MRYVHKPIIKIPEYRLPDVENLANFIINNMNIEISLEDTYLFWDEVSDSHCAGWLNINYCYEGYSREEFILSMMKKFGTLVL